MSKIIIENRSDEITDIEALELVKAVMSMGRISEGLKGPQYCYHTVFPYRPQGERSVSAFTNKKSDRFVVM